MSRGPPRGYQPLAGGGSGAGLFDRRQPSPAQPQYPPTSSGSHDPRGIDRRQQTYTPPRQGPRPPSYPPQHQPQSNNTSAASGFFSKLTRLGMGGRQSGGVFRVGKVVQKRSFCVIVLTRVSGTQSSSLLEESIVCQLGRFWIEYCLCHRRRHVRL